MISAYHDLGKYIDHNIHEKIAADLFFKDKKMEQFFNSKERKLIKEAIKDHRSSFDEESRSIYGKLISSADRNTSIEMVFIRSFFVAQARMPEMIIEEYLDYTYKRLSKRYDDNSRENMFLEDETYRNFLKDMQILLKDEKRFKDIYCDVNKINNRKLKVADYI